jgi:hypothetical protein
MKSQEMQELPGLGRRLCTIAIVGLVIAAGFGLVVDRVVPDVLGDNFAITETEASGTVGSSMTLSTMQSFNDVILLNDSSFSHESEWKMDFIELNEQTPKIQRMPRESGVQLDLSNVDVSYNYDTNINLRDYENVTVSLDVLVLRGPIEISLALEAFNDLANPGLTGASARNSQTLSTGNSTHLVVELDTNSLYEQWSPLWLAQSFVEIEIYPVSSNWYERQGIPLKASLILENVTVSAKSTIPLSRLQVDIQDTQGYSIYESGVNLNWIKWPAINLTSDTTADKWGIFQPWRSNDTLYVSAGNYSGVAGFYSYGTSNDTFIVSFEILPDTDLLLGLRFEMIRVSLSVSQPVPYLRVVLIYSEYVFDDYRVELAPPFPNTLYIPKRIAKLNIYIQTRQGVENSNLVYEASVQVSEPLNVDIQLRIPVFPIFGVLLSTGQVLLVSLGVALLIGAILSFQKPSAQKNWGLVLRDPRFWPAVLVGISAFFPWFSSFYVLEQIQWTVGESVLIHRNLYLPFALSLDSTANSFAALVVSRYVILEVPTRIILFWLPLRWAFGHSGNPQKWKFNFYYALWLLLPLFMGVAAYLTIPIPLNLSTGFFVVLAAPILWIFEILIYRWHKKPRE